MKALYLSLILLTTLFYSCKKDSNNGVKTDPNQPYIRTLNGRDANSNLAMGKPNDVIELKGNRFSQDYTKSKVLFNGISSDAIYGDSLTVGVQIPNGVAPGAVKMTLISNGYTVDLPSSQTVLSPNPQITDIAPLTGMVGSRGFISGTDISTDIADNKITVNGASATVEGAYRNGVFFIVPQTIGSGKVTLTTHGTTLTYNQNFNTIPSTFTTLGQTVDQPITALSLDAGGNLYGILNNTVLKIQADGTSSVLATIGSSVTPVTTLGGCVTDATGNIYVSSPYDYKGAKDSYQYTSNSSKIYKITPSGTVSIFAGSTRGTTDGQGTAAQFYTPTDMTIDASGNIYVKDQNAIRKITSNGVVTTFAGNITTGGTINAVGTAARFSTILSMKVDKTTNNIYVSEPVTFGNSYSAQIRKVASDGTVTSTSFTPATDALPGSLFPSVGGLQATIAVSDKGILYVACSTSLYRIENGTTTNSFLNPSGGQIISLVTDPTGRIYVFSQIPSISKYALFKITP